MKRFIQVSTTTDSKEEAERIALALVEMRFAACVQILGPVESVYRWKDHVEKAVEWLCLIKCREECFGAVERGIRSMHSYETPEIIAVPITAGSSRYLRWIEEQTTCPSRE